MANSEGKLQEILDKENKKEGLSTKIFFFNLFTPTKTIKAITQQRFAEHERNKKDNKRTDSMRQKTTIDIAYKFVMVVVDRKAAHRKRVLQARSSRKKLYA